MVEDGSGAGGGVWGGGCGGGVEFVNDACVRCPFHPRVTATARKRSPVILPKVQVAGYTFDPIKSEWADYAAI